MKKKPPQYLDQFAVVHMRDVYRVMAALRQEGLKHPINTKSLWIKRVNQAYELMCDKYAIQEDDKMMIDKEFVTFLIDVINSLETRDEHKETYASLYDAFIKHRYKGLI